ncbi:MAG: DUF2807 domain-containing protein [Pseudomonadota bacterium]
MPLAIKYIFAVLCALLLSFAAASAEDERTFEVSEFDRIDVSAGINVIAEVGQPQSIVVRTDNGDYTDFKIAVKNGALYVSRDWNRLRWHQKKSSYKVIVTTPTLRGLDASSGSQAKISNVAASRFDIDLSSGAYAKVEGACEDCTVDLSSGARLKAQELECETVNIDVSSGGHGEISASRAVLADASSGGHFTVYGNPERVNIDKSSGGRIYVAATAQATRD